MARFSRAILILCILSAAFISQAAGLGVIRFVIVDPLTQLPVSGEVHVSDTLGREAVLNAGLLQHGQTEAFDTSVWAPTFWADISGAEPTAITIPLGVTVTIQQQTPVPTKEIVIRVTATRLAAPPAPSYSSGDSRSKETIQKFVNTTGSDAKQLTKGQPGITEDSAGQAHVRGEHSEVTYVVDGVQLPDTLSGRQGAIVVPSTIQNLDIITGGFAAQYGGQTAAVLDITTISSFSKRTTDLQLQGGNYDTGTVDITSEGPLGSKASYVVDLNANRTNNAIEPQQPDNQTAHNYGDNESAFTKLRYSPDARDDLALTVSGNPNYLQIGNRTGLPSSFYDAGEGYGFEGQRNADGTRPASTIVVPGALGSQKIALGSQQQDGMDIDQREIDEFGVLNYRHRFDQRDSGQLAVTILHSGQDVSNNNPTVDLGSLPVDNSIEYNPTAHRNVHHIQVTGSYDAVRGGHDLTAGFIFDQQGGVESYQIIPASQLALDELAALDPGLAPAGTASSTKDVNGNPIYTATSGVSPTITVTREGQYSAGYAQDTWKLGRLVSNYGLRLDHYFQQESISTVNVDDTILSPRLNFSYNLDRIDDLRWSYDHILNTPPLAQGAIVGTPIQPEIIDQYDLAISRKVARNQVANLAYYYKQIQNQVDTGLLIPGSEIGLYSAVNFQHGGVHGIEASYDITAPKGVGWDEYFNYTYSNAQPSGLDNTGQPAPQYNDHDQRHTVGLGLAYTLKSGLSVAGTFQFNSGLASSVVPPGTDRTPRSQLDLHATTGDRMFKGHGGLEFDVENVFDSRQVINFDSGFSGTRFQDGRKIVVGATFHL
jgi:hypothetical protein